MLACTRLNVGAGCSIKRNLTAHLLLRFVYITTCMCLTKLWILTFVCRLDLYGIFLDDQNCFFLN